MAGKCRPGTYQGQFTCDVATLLGKLTFSGPVSFTLAASPSGEFLEISNGTLQANANGGIPIMADLSGKLDCSTNELHASTMNGMATILIFAQTFFGVLDGHLDRLTETLTGTWTLTPELGAPGSGGASGAGGAAGLTYGCMGTWSVARQ